MLGLIRRYRFAAVVAVGLCLMAAFVVGKALFSFGAGDDQARAAAPAGGPGRGGGPTVVAVAADMHTFTDGLQALGTAQARESIPRID